MTPPGFDLTDLGSESRRLIFYWAKTWKVTKLLQLKTNENENLVLNYE
jgi:hypothetical protein